MEGIGDNGAKSQQKWLSGNVHSGVENGFSKADGDRSSSQAGSCPSNQVGGWSSLFNPLINQIPSIYVKNVPKSSPKDRKTSSFNVEFNNNE